jgi:hypothetical protein
MTGGALYRQMPDASTRRVPPPAERKALVELTHQRCGHFGEKRTVSLLAAGYWWRGMSNDAKAMVRACPTCCNVGASFNTSTPVLQPLSIEGLF